MNENDSAAEITRMCGLGKGPAIGKGPADINQELINRRKALEAQYKATEAVEMTQEEVDGLGSKQREAELLLKLTEARRLPGELASVMNERLEPVIRILEMLVKRIENIKLTVEHRPPVQPAAKQDFTAVYALLSAIIVIQILSIFFR